MYWNNREQSRRTFMGEWTRSGDKYLQDEDGYFVYCGRNDDMLKVSGIYVSPFEVEGALADPSRRAGMRGGGLARRRRADQAEGLRGAEGPGQGRRRRSARAALQDHVKAKLAPFKYPRWIEFRADLPKTATGKIQRFKLRRKPG